MGKWLIWAEYFTGAALLILISAGGAMVMPRVIEMRLHHQLVPGGALRRLEKYA